MRFGGKRLQQGNQDTYGTIANADVKKGKEYSHCFCVLRVDSNYLLESMTVWIKNFGQKVKEKQKHIVVNITISKGGFFRERKKTIELVNTMG